MILYRLAKAYIEACDIQEQDSVISLADRWKKLKAYVETTAGRTNSIPGSCPDASRILQMMKTLEER